MLFPTDGVSVEPEWLETDGLGGFASGTVSLPRTRRYHALLTRAAGSPSHRFVLVNGCDVFLRTPAGEFAVSAQRYLPGVLAPDGAARLESFFADPWPAWTFQMPGDRRLRQEILVSREHAATVLTWKLSGDPAGCTLAVRPFFSGRDLHSLHHENGAFSFAPQRTGALLVWNPYAGVPPVVIGSSGSYAHEPHWYRDFFYAEERARGLDDVEDLASPGIFSCDLADGDAVMILSSADSAGGDFTFLNGRPREVASSLREAERKRRNAFPTPLHRAAEDYLVRRGQGQTIIAGYPWFADWGRDTFIALRGLFIATGRLDVAAAILLEWSGMVSEGMMPNFFPEGTARQEYNSVDAALWFIIAVHEFIDAAAAGGVDVSSGDRQRLGDAVGAILKAYAAGTRFGIRADSDGLLYAGQAGVQLTWMDAKVGDWVVTPRIGKPVEVQALWINALRIGAGFDPAWSVLAGRATQSFLPRFWNESRGCLFDVVDVDFVPGRNDATVRPNQIFAIGGLPYPLLEGAAAARVLTVVEQSLLTPLGLRSLSPDDPDYQAHYAGGVRERDGAYHQGTVWPWLTCAFVEAWLRVHGTSAQTMEEARVRFLSPLLAHTSEAGLGHVSEIADAEFPFTPRGCPFQAWSVGEMLRLTKILSPVTL